MLRRGGLVAFPTETVYGLGADATNARAVASIYAAKQRPQFNPLIVHVTCLAAAEQLAQFTALGRKLASTFWPGPLTIVADRRPTCPIADLATAGLSTIALRVPSHEIALAILQAANIPVAAPSANRSGRISPTTAAHVAADFNDEVSLILDGGSCDVGLESTVIDTTTGTPVILRPGGITREQVEEALGCEVNISNAGDHSTPSSPGQLVSHYAPRASLRLNITEPRAGEALLAFGQNAPTDHPHTVNLSTTGDLIEAATNLFGALHQLDATDVTSIAAMPIPNHGLGVAINDRLQRAAAPRE